MTTIERDTQRVFRALRKQQGWTQADLARLLDTTTPTIGRYEAGGAEPPPLLVRLVMLCLVHPELIQWLQADQPPMGVRPGWRRNKAADA